MRSKYCIKCGEQVISNKATCENCNATITEMPVTDGQKELIEKMQQDYVDNPPSKVKGCLVTLGMLTFMFGLPALITFGGIRLDGILGISLIVLVFLAINFLMYKHRKNLKYKQKRFYYLTKKSESELMNLPKICRRCNQLLTPEMVFCPKCGLHIHEDLPVDLRQIVNPKERKIKPQKSEIKPSVTEKPKVVEEVSPQQDTIQQNKGQKFCMNCGTNVEGKKFCPECGTKTEVI